jgi:hypothetical protein
MQYETSYKATSWVGMQAIPANTAPTGGKSYWTRELDRRMDEWIAHRECGLSRPNFPKWKSRNRKTWICLMPPSPVLIKYRQRQQGKKNNAMFLSTKEK